MEGKCNVMCRVPDRRNVTWMTMTSGQGIYFLQMDTTIQPYAPTTVQ